MKCLIKWLFMVDEKDKMTILPLILFPLFFSPLAFFSFFLLNPPLGISQPVAYGHRRTSAPMPDGLGDLGGPRLAAPRGGPAIPRPVAQLSLPSACMVAPLGDTGSPRGILAPGGAALAPKRSPLGDPGVPVLRSARMAQ